MRSIKYILLYLIIIQLVLPFLIPLNLVYNYRMDYELVKNKIDDLDGVLEQISRKIKNKNEENYLIILGDSVAYSGPGRPEQSISYYLTEISSQEGKKIPVYNLALPAMQTGDVYTMLLKLNEYGIKTDHLIINLVYAGFVERNPDPPSVFWLGQELRRLDQVTYSQVKEGLKANGKVETGFKAVEQRLSSFLSRKISLLKYKDYLFQLLTSGFNRDKTHDSELEKPWYEKESLKELLAQPEYQKGFADKTFILDETNPQTFFLNKILSFQEGKKTLVFLSPVNGQLMNEQINKPGYRKNLELIDHFFADRQVTYLNLHDSLPGELFSDHVHLIPRGYYELAQILWKQLKNSGMIN